VATSLDYWVTDAISCPVIGEGVSLDHWVSSSIAMPVAVAEEESSLSSISTSTSSIGSITSYSRSNVTNPYVLTRHFTPLQLFQNTI